MPQAASIFLHHVGAAELLWHNSTNRGGQTFYTCHLTTWPSCGAHHFYLHLVLWPYLMQEGLGNVAPVWLATSQQQLYTMEEELNLSWSPPQVASIYTTLTICQAMCYVLFNLTFIPTLQG